MFTEDVKQQYNNNNTMKASRYSGVKLILSEVNLEDYNLDQVKNNLKNRYKNIWFINFHKEAMQNQGKLRTLYLFKSCFQRERYLKTVTDARRRQCLTQL